MDPKESCDNDSVSLGHYKMASFGQPVPSGHTSSSRAVPGLRRRPSSADLPHNQLPPQLLRTTSSAMSFARCESLSSLLPAAKDTSTKSCVDGRVATTASANPNMRRVRPRLGNPLTHLAPPHDPHDHQQLQASQQPRITRLPFRQRDELPRHRTVLNYALPIFEKHLATWVDFLRNPDRESSPISTARGDQGRPPVALTPQPGGGVTVPSSEDIAQLISAVTALQDALRDVSGGGGGGLQMSSTATITPRDLRDLWLLCSMCLKAAVNAASAGGALPGTLALSRTLQGLGEKLYDAFCEQQPQIRGDVDAAAAAAEAAVVTNGSDGGDAEGAGCNNGAELITRVAFFLRIGKAWLSFNQDSQAAWHLTRAREGLGQLQIYATGDTQTLAVPQTRRRAARINRCSDSNQDPSVDSQGLEAEGMGEGGRVAGGSGEGGAGGRWHRLGIKDSEYIAVKAGVLVASLQLALREDQKSLVSNLICQLQLLLRCNEMPPDLATATAMDAASALMLAASMKLPGGDRGLDNASAGGGQPSQGSRSQQPPAHLPVSLQEEGLRLLVEVLGLVEEVSKGIGGAQTETVEAEDEGETQGLWRGPREMCPSHELSKLRLEALMMLISGNLRLKNFDEALSYIQEYEKSLAHGLSARCPATTPSSAPAVALRLSEAPGAATAATRAHGAAASSSPFVVRGTPLVHLPILLFKMRVYLGLGKAASAADVLATQVESHPASNHDTIKTALTLLLEALSLEQLLSALPAIMTCLLACLERCRQKGGRASGGAGSGGTDTGAAWPPEAGAKLLLQVITAIAGHEGALAEQQLLALLAKDDVISAVSEVAAPRDRLHNLLFMRAAAAYQQSDILAATRMFEAALLYAATGSTAPYCRTARMLSHCYAAVGQTRMAVGYLDLVERREPNTATLRLLRLRLVLRLQARKATIGGGGGSGSGGGNGGGGGELFASRSTTKVNVLERQQACTRFGGVGMPHCGGNSVSVNINYSGSAGTDSVMEDDEEPLKLVTQLPNCADFETYHLTVRCAVGVAYGCCDLTLHSTAFTALARASLIN